MPVSLVQVYLHSSNETADFASQRLESPAGSYKTLDISALSIYSSTEAADLRVEQRRCRFLHETNLVLSPVYSYNLCRNECRMKLAFDRCGCVPHFYRPVRKNPTHILTTFHMENMFENVDKYW